MVSQADLTGTAAHCGETSLTSALSHALTPCRKALPVDDTSKIVTDLVVSVAASGEHERAPTPPRHRDFRLALSPGAT